VVECRLELWLVMVEYGVSSSTGVANHSMRCDILALIPILSPDFGNGHCHGLLLFLSSSLYHHHNTTKTIIIIYANDAETAYGHFPLLLVSVLIVYFSLLCA
jgi:hypothetical protein